MPRSRPSAKPAAGSTGRGYCVIAVAVLGALLYANTYEADFAYDDSRAIKTNQDLHWRTPLTDLLKHDFWGLKLTHSGSHKSYRPLTVLTFRLNYYFSGLSSASGYHLFNLILHGIVSGLFTYFASTLFAGEWRPTLVAGTVFAAHPIHSEAVAGCVGRADILAALFFLLAILSYKSYVRTREKGTWPAYGYLYGSLALAACSLLSKENGLTVIAVCAVYHVCQHHKTLWCPSFQVLAIITQKRFGVLREGLFHLAAFGTLMLGTRLYLMGLKAPDFAAADNPAADASSWLTRTLTFLYLPSFNFYLLVFPRWLSFDWSMNAIPLIQSFVDIRNVATFVFYASLGSLLKACWNSMQNGAGQPAPSSSSSPSCLTCVYQPVASQHTRHQKPRSHAGHRHSTNNNSVCVCKELQLPCGAAGTGAYGTSLACDADETCSTSSSMLSTTSTSSTTRAYRSRCLESERLTFATSLLILPFLPATNLLFYVGFVVAERVLYIPSMGFCLLIAIGTETLMKRKTSKFITLIALSILLMSFAARTWQRNIDWQTEEKLYTAGVAINPPKSYGNLANILSASGQKHEAELAYRKALTFRYNMADVHYNLGLLLQEQNRLDEALASYQNAIRFRPRLAMAHLNLGMVLGLLGRHEEAEEVYKHCAGIDGTGLKDPKTHEATRVSALFNLGRLFADRGRYEDAIGMYQQAIEKMPRTYQAQSLYNMIGEAYGKLGQYDKAEEWYKQALRAKPDHVPAHLTYAKLLAKMRRKDEAEVWFLKAKAIAPNDTSVFQHYGQFLSECERHDEAAQLYMKGVHAAPGDYEMVFNLANALRQANRGGEAERFYKEAVRLRPNEVTSHMNLGAMLHVNGKLLEAESSYLEALRLKPDDAITQNNLAKLRTLLEKRVLHVRR